MHLGILCWNTTLNTENHLGTDLMSCVGEMHLTCCGLTQYGESFICVFWPFYSAVICISAENISWCRRRSQQILPDCFTFNKDWVLIPDSCGLIGFIPSCQWKLAVCFQVVHVCRPVPISGMCWGNVTASRTNILTVLWSHCESRKHILSQNGRKLHTNLW